MKILKFRRSPIDIEQQIARNQDDLFLVELIKEALTEAEDSSQTSQNGRCLELGGAGGLTKQLRHSWFISDVRSCSGVDAVFSACAMPLVDNSIDLIFAQDVFHHIPDLNAFSLEIHRVLKPGGSIFFREPYWGPLAQILWRFFHPEDFSIKRLQISNEFSHSMDGNQALAYALLRKKRTDILDIFEGFEIKEFGPRLGIAFLMSGGSTFTTAIPRPFLLLLHRFEKTIPGWLKIFGFAYTFSLKKPEKIEQV